LIFLQHIIMDPYQHLNDERTGEINLRIHPDQCEKEAQEEIEENPGDFDEQVGRTSVSEPDSVIHRNASRPRPAERFSPLECRHLTTWNKVVGGGQCEGMLDLVPSHNTVERSSTFQCSGCGTIVCSECRDALSDENFVPRTIPEDVDDYDRSFSEATGLLNSNQTIAEDVDNDNQSSSETTDLRASSKTTTTSRDTTPKGKRKQELSRAVKEKRYKLKLLNSRLEQAAYSRLDPIALKGILPEYLVERPWIVERDWEDRYELSYFGAYYSVVP
jgi:hypothetical protein